MLAILTGISRMSWIYGAASQLTQTLDDLKVPYAIMGGSACYLLGSLRSTTDIDLVVDVSDINGLTVEGLSTALKKIPGFTQVDNDGIGYFIPAIALPDVPVVPLEIFDPEVWSQRPQYQQVKTHRINVQLPDGRAAWVFSPAWLLREKIMSIQGRGYPGTKKFHTDLVDVEFLFSMIKEEDYGVGLLDLSGQQERIDCLRGFLERKDVISNVKDKISKVFKKSILM